MADDSSVWILHFPFLQKEMIYWKNRTPVHTKAHIPDFTVISSLIEHPDLPRVFACGISCDSLSVLGLCHGILHYFTNHVPERRMA